MMLLILQSTINYEYLQAAGCYSANLVTDIIENANIVGL